MKLGKLAAVVLLSVASAGLTAPVSAAPLSVDIRIAPPAPRYEAVPAVRRGSSFRRKCGRPSIGWRVPALRSRPRDLVGRCSA